MSALGHLYKVYLENIELEHGRDVFRQEFRNVIDMSFFEC